MYTEIFPDIDPTPRKMPSGLTFKQKYFNVFNSNTDKYFKIKKNRKIKMFLFNRVIL